MRDLTNEKFNQWTVLNYCGKNKHNKPVWLCKCSCGTIKKVQQGNLLLGRSKKCRTINKHKNIDSKVYHRLYSTWASMKGRCNNKNSTSYKYYGGRGIKVCDRWNDFNLFIKDMYPSFKEGTTLDRIDNNRGYFKGNCKWSTKKEQCNNQRKNLRLLYQGKILTESQLSDLTGVKRTTIQSRRNKGYDVEEMINGKKYGLN